MLSVSYYFILLNCTCLILEGSGLNKYWTCVFILLLYKYPTGVQFLRCWLHLISDEILISFSKGTVDFWYDLEILQICIISVNSVF